MSEADIAVDNFLRERLTRLAPDCGWLSEETEDDRARLQASRAVGRRSDRRHARLSVRPHRLVDFGRAGGERPSRDRRDFRARAGRALRCGAPEAPTTLNGAAVTANAGVELRRHQGRGPEADAGAARQARAGSHHGTEGVFAGAAPCARRRRHARSGVRLGQQPRLGPCGCRSFGARSRRRIDDIRGSNRSSTIAPIRCMARLLPPGVRVTRRSSRSLREKTLAFA